MKKMITFSLSVFASLVYGATDPDYLNLKVYKVAVSENANCTNLKTIMENASPSYEDILPGPTLGQGQVDSGTYNCIAIEMSSVIQYAPKTNDDDDGDGTYNCQAGAASQLDVCSADNSGSTIMIDGTSKNCSNGEDRITMYLSTSSTSTGGINGVFTPPVDSDWANKGLKLTNALVVDGNTSAKFVVNATSKVVDTGASCEMQPPLFSMEKI